MSHRRIDHLVLAVDDLDRAAATFEELGFQVGARNRHPWGTENRLIQFRSSFLELITVADAGAIPPHAPGAFSFGAFVRDYLRHREGLAMIALDSRDAAHDATVFAGAGIGDYRPFTFEREGRQPDGTRSHVAFSLAFATDDRLPDVGFFVCQHHYPQAFWNPELQRHPNGAVDIVEVELTVAEPSEHTAYLEAFVGSGSPTRAGCYEFENGGTLRLTAGPGGHGLTAFTVAVDDGGAPAQHDDECLEVATEWRDNAVRITLHAAQVRRGK